MRLLGWLKNAFINDNGKTHDCDIMSPSLSKTRNQVTRVFLICKLGLDLAFTLRLCHILLEWLSGVFRLYRGAGLKLLSRVI
jgi:hypothetical protein